MKNVKKPKRFSYQECTDSTMFSNAFCMILIDNTKPIGHPVNKEQAVFLSEWLNSVVVEYNEETDQQDIY